MNRLETIVTDWLTIESALSLGLLLIQVPATAVLLSRLLKGPSRQPPIEPQAPVPELLAKVSVVVPTLNEAQRISPCLAGLSRQSYGCYQRPGRKQGCDAASA